MSREEDAKRSQATGRKRRPAREAPPATVEEALERALRHGRNAAAEALAAARALVDALSLATAGRPPAERSALGLAAQALDACADLLAGSEGGGADALLSAVADALDAEIARWEARASDDGDARAVMRAFLGLREILWELGVRRGTGAGEAGAKPAPGPRAAGAPRRSARAPGPPRRRVQRVPVEG